MRYSWNGSVSAAAQQQQQGVQQQQQLSPLAFFSAVLTDPMPE